MTCQECIEDTPHLFTDSCTLEPTDGYFVDDMSDFRAPSFHKPWWLDDDGDGDNDDDIYDWIENGMEN